MLTATPCSSEGKDSDSESRRPSSISRISLSMRRKGCRMPRITSEIASSITAATAANHVKSCRRNAAICAWNVSRSSATLNV